MTSPKRSNPETVSVIQAVQSPLGFFTLGLLIFEAALLLVAATLEASERIPLLWGCLLLIFATILMVGVLAFLKPNLFTTATSLLDASSINSRNNIGKRENFVYDLFISAPMTSSELDYQTVRNDVLMIIEELEKKGFTRIYYAGRYMSDLSEVDPASVSIKKDLKALSESKYFMLIFPQRLPSSCLVESGYALAFKIPSIYLVRDDKDLPYMLREMPESMARRFNYEDQQNLRFLITRYVYETFLEGSA